MTYFSLNLFDISRLHSLSVSVFKLSHISKILELLYLFVSNEFLGGFLGISLRVICYLLKDLKASWAFAIT